MMFGSRRLAKRSIIGTRICAPWQDGRFYPGVIQAVKEMPSGQNWYSILFDDGYNRELTDSDIIGPGFQGINGRHLKHGQRIFLTQNGREVAGVVIKHDRATDDVLVEASMSEIDRLELVRKLDDLRLLESRKSARLLDSDTDYSKLADVQLQPESKKRTVSHVIDVPAKCSHLRRPQNEELDDIEMMDENMAAMVLTSLSCSPVSPKFPTNFSGKNDEFETSPKSEVGSLASSGFHSGTPSPPQLLSSSAPDSSHFDSLTHEDEGIDVDENPEISTRTVFKCSWPGCVHICEMCRDIERHIRVEHLKKAEDFNCRTSDHEEEFYYSEVEIGSDSMIDPLGDMACTSPTATLFPVRSQALGIPVTDHDYQRKDIKFHIPPSHGMSSSVPINIPHIQESLSWQQPVGSSVSPPCRVIRHSSHDRLQQHQAQSPKSHFFGSPKSPTHKKSRSEVKKCRKVYGMENRDMWCTQCKWKKACSRFME